MYKLHASSEKYAYEISELAKMFLRDDEFQIEIADSDLSKDDQKRAAYDLLSKSLGKELDWGILTGVRPLKLFNELCEKSGSSSAKKKMKDDYYLSDDKIKLLEDTHKVQQELGFDDNPKACGLYIGIPFCPTRCLYCSFTSNKITKEAAQLYLPALEKEIAAVASLMNKQGRYAESIYIGGGTPSSLDEYDFEKLLNIACENFSSDKLKEFTVECGRPDTITKEKLKLLQKYDIRRISINPQTLKDETLKLIGRQHSSEQIIEAYKLARECGDFIINMDLICGLPGEDESDFENTLSRIIELDPENITVHTLAVKRASRLIEQDKDFAFRQADTVKKMIDVSHRLLDASGYQPYYLYRQKHMAGNFENVGYCKKGFPSIYNIRIMEENQSIIAMGAGGISKLYFPDENRLERIPNVSNYQIYIERIDEMIQRKEKGIV